jgi:hypothetical protein
MTAALSVIRRVLAGTGSTAFTLVGALLIGFGVPLLWIWIASHIYTKTGPVSFSIAAFIGTGIVISYWGVLLVASWVRGRHAYQSGPRRANWNRSLRDAPVGSRHSDPMERLLVATALISLVALAVWFFLFSGGGGAGGDISGPADVL